MFSFMKLTNDQLDKFENSLLIKKNTRQTVTVKEYF